MLVSDIMCTDCSPDSLYTTLALRLLKIELFDRLDDADIWPGVLGAILISILPSPDHKVVWKISDILDGTL